MARIRCQHSHKCTDSPEKKSPFCKKHKDTIPNMKLLSGAEPEYKPSIYNTSAKLKDNLNCFAYAFDYRELPDSCATNECSISFPQPGRKSGYPKWSEVDGKRCPDLIARIFGDIGYNKYMPGIRMSTFTERPPKGMYKIAMVIDANNDYHFYRQDNNGYWSHKPGATNVTNIDAEGSLIYNPELASRYYPKSGLEYKEFCGYMVVHSIFKINKKNRKNNRPIFMLSIGGKRYTKTIKKNRLTRRNTTRHVCR